MLMRASRASPSYSKDFTKKALRAKRSRPLAFVISKNVARRHLNESQRAMAAARLANMQQGERTDLSPPANLLKVSQADAARVLNVSEGSWRGFVELR